MNQALCSVVSPAYRLLRRVMTMGSTPKLLRRELRGETRFEEQGLPVARFCVLAIDDFCREPVLLCHRRWL